MISSNFLSSLSHNTIGLYWCVHTSHPQYIIPVACGVITPTLHITTPYLFSLCECGSPTSLTRTWCGSSDSMTPAFAWLWVLWCHMLFHPAADISTTPYWHQTRLSLAGYPLLLHQVVWCSHPLDWLASGWCHLIMWYSLCDSECCNSWGSELGAIQLSMQATDLDDDDEASFSLAILDGEWWVGISTINKPMDKQDRWWLSHQVHGMYVTITGWGGLLLIVVGCLNWQFRQVLLLTFTLLCSKFNPLNLICFPTLNDLLQVMNIGILWLLQCPTQIMLHINCNALFNGEF